MLRRSDFIAATYALSLVLANFGIAIAARMPMMTTTIRSSMRVKPFLLLIQDSPETLVNRRRLSGPLAFKRRGQLKRGNPPTGNGRTAIAVRQLSANHPSTYVRRVDGADSRKSVAFCKTSCSLRRRRRQEPGVCHWTILPAPAYHETPDPR